MKIIPSLTSLNRRNFINGGNALAIVSYIFLIGTLPPLHAGTFDTITSVANSTGATDAATSAAQGMFQKNLENVMKQSQINDSAGSGGGSPTSGGSGGSPTSGGSGGSPMSGGSGSSMSSGASSMGGGGGGGGVDTYVYGTGMNMNEMMALNSIKSDATKIESNMAKAEKNIANMREVMAAKQKLTASLAKMSALASHGQVVQSDPFGAESSGQQAGGNSAENVISSLLKSADIGAADGSGEGLESMAGIKERAGSSGGIVDGLMSNAASVGMNAGSAWLQDQAAKDKSGAASTALNVAGQILGGSSVYDLAVSMAGGKLGFEGMNANNIANIMGVVGRIVAQDELSPEQLYPLTASMMQKLGGAVSGVTTANAKGSKPRLISDGFYIRKESPYDGAYYAMVQRGTGATGLQFLAAVSRGEAVIYSPTMGNAAPNKGFVASVNMNNVLSSGAYQAVEQYNAQVGGHTNPYTDFAQTIAPVLPNIAQKTAPNRDLIVSVSEMNAAKSSKPVSLSSFPTLASMVNKPKSDTEICFAPPTKEKMYSNYLAVANNSDGGGVAVIKPTQQGISELMSQMAASNTRLKQNSSMLVVTQLMLKYSKSVLSATAALRQELSSIVGAGSGYNFDKGINLIQCSTGMFGQVAGSAVNAATSKLPDSAKNAVSSALNSGMSSSQQSSGLQMDSSNAVESVLGMITNCDNITLVLQKQIADYTYDTDRLLRERHSELKSRAETYNIAREKNSNSVEARIRSALLLGASQ